MHNFAKAIQLQPSWGWKSSIRETPVMVPHPALIVIKKLGDQGEETPRINVKKDQVMSKKVKQHRKEREGK